MPGKLKIDRTKIKEVQIGFTAKGLLSGQAGVSGAYAMEFWIKFIPENRERQGR